MKTSSLVSIALALLLLALVGIPLAQDKPALAAGDPSWWNALWHYRKTITITELSGSTLTDYQIKLTVTYDSDMQSNFDDIRFVDSDNATELGHWLESYTASSSAIFWVKVPSIPASGTKKIYMYYGNAGASSASSGTATFDFFDDFSGGLGSWTQQRGTWAINDDGRVYCSADSGNNFNALVSSYTGSDYIAEADMIVGDVTAGVATRYDETNDYFYAAQANVELDRLEVNKYKTGWEGLGSTSQSYNQGDSIQMRVTATGWNIEGKDLTNNVTASGPDTEFTSGYAGLIANSGFTTSPQFDNFRVRKYAFPEPATSFSLEQVPLPLISGWGWCLAYKDIGDVTLDLAGSMVPRANAPEVVDLYLVGTLNFSIPGRTDTFEVELLGTRVRSLFFLKQVEGGANPLIAEFEGFWLAENNYIVCEGRLAITTPNHAAQPYAFVLRTGGVDVPSREPGGWVGDIEFIIQKGVLALDIVGDRLAQGGAVIKDLLGTVLTQAAVIVREVRKLGIPYIS